eukprot:1159782-Pelagomonas_calceolata.AAC.4
MMSNCLEVLGKSKTVLLPTHLRTALDEKQVAVHAAHHAHERWASRACSELGDISCECCDDSALLWLASGIPLVHAHDDLMMDGLHAMICI